MVAVRVVLQQNFSLNGVVRQTGNTEIHSTNARRWDKCKMPYKAAIYKFFFGLVDVTNLHDNFGLKNVCAQYSRTQLVRRVRRDIRRSHNFCRSREHTHTHTQRVREKCHFKCFSRVSVCVCKTTKLHV